MGKKMVLLEAKRNREGKRKGKKIPAPAPPKYGHLFDIQTYLRQGFGINVDVGMLVANLIRDGSITDGDFLLRYKESFKQSWEVSMRSPICFDYLSCSFLTDPSAREIIQRYLDSAEETKYFDADRMDQPEGMAPGFYLLYPAHPPQLNEKNPILATEPKLVNYAANLDKLAIAAVLCHNELTHSDLFFHRVVKSNIFFDVGFQVYFITLEASPDGDGPLVVCKSRVDCSVDISDAPRFHGESSIRTVYVDSFHVEKNCLREEP